MDIAPVDYLSIMRATLVRTVLRTSPTNTSKCEFSVAKFDVSHSGTQKRVHLLARGLSLTTALRAKNISIETRRRSFRKVLSRVVDELVKLCT